MNVASEYRKRTIETASPVGLVVLLYGGAITGLMRAIAAIEANNTEERVSELNRVLQILAQLQGTLNFEQGGEVARSLEKFYVVMRSQILEASIKNSRPILQDMVKEFTSLKEAWQEVDRQTRMNGATGLSPLPQTSALPLQSVQPMALAAR